MACAVQLFSQPVVVFSFLVTRLGFLLLLIENIIGSSPAGLVSKKKKINCKYVQMQRKFLKMNMFRLVECWKEGRGKQP